MADDGRLFLGEQVPDESDQLVADRRAHQQRARQLPDDLRVGRRQARKVADLLRPDRFGPRLDRADNPLVYLDDAPTAGVFGHAAAPVVAKLQISR